MGYQRRVHGEYGSHPCTFEIDKPGTVCIVVNETEQILMGHKVDAGDIYRSCQTKDAPIKDWVKLAVNRCRANNFPNNDKPCKAIFWLGSARGGLAPCCGIAHVVPSERSCSEGCCAARFQCLGHPS